MEFINEEIQTKLGLTPDQITALTPLYSDHVANMKKEWDGKANKDAEGILTGAATSIEKLTGLKRGDGEKIAEYISRSGAEFLKAKETEISNLKADYEKKLKDFDGSNDLKTELEAARLKLDEAQRRYADYDALKEKAEKYDPISEEYKVMKREVSFSSARPNFPETANEYEVKAKWDDFKARVEKDWNIEYKDGEAICVNKENPYKIEKLKDLVSKDAIITGIVAGRQQAGSGASGKDLKKIEGLPFEVPVGADTKERVELIRQQCAKEGLTPIMGAAYSSRFKEMNDLIQKQGTAK